MPASLRPCVATAIGSTRQASLHAEPVGERHERLLRYP